MEPSLSQIPEFIAKLHEMIQNYPQIISFSQNGQEVLIHSYQKFVSSLLPKYFRHKNWRSFVRQMNMYNFRKLNRGLQIYMFINDIFRQGNQQNYHLIKRKQIIKPQDGRAGDSLEQSLFFQIQNEYGVQSLSNFIYQSLQFQQRTQNICKQLKKTLETINSLKNTASTRSCVSRVKDFTQTISEATKKMKENLRIQGQHYQKNFSLLKESQIQGINISSNKLLPTNNLLMPKPINSGVNKLPEEFRDGVNCENMMCRTQEEPKTRKQSKQGENKFVITALCSFNSVNSLDRFMSL